MILIYREKGGTHKALVLTLGGNRHRRGTGKLDSGAGNGVDDVFLNQDGPFFTPDKTAFIPSSNQAITTNTEVDFNSVADKDAFILLHELGHQVGIFPADLFKWISGSHSRRVLENCFKEVHLD